MQPSLLLSSAILLFLFASLGSSSTDEGLGAAVLPLASEASSSSTASSARPQPDPSNLVIPEPGLGNLTASNETLSSSNLTASNSSLWENGTFSTSTTTTTTTALPVDPILPHKGAAEEERHSSMAIFFVLSVIGSCILLIHFLLETKFSYIPESLAVVFLGAAIGLVMKLCSANFGDWKKEETLSPTMFFLILLPPIMYESGYTLHKGNFFQNIGSILVFAIIGTSISAFVIGGGVYVLGVADVAYRLSFTEAFAFGSLISAVDPVATLAIFHALNLDPILNMLVFGESILNDAVAIVLATTALELNRDSTVSAAAASSLITSDLSSGAIFINGVLRFLVVFFGSALVGVAFALIAALVFKYVDLRKHPSLEFGMMLIFIYSPYGLAEGLHLSGIMAILFNGVVMSHYAHFNLSPVTQITMQQTLRTLSFIAETCVFAYLGLAIFSFHMKIELSLIVWSIILCLLGRAVNIYPLSYLVNYFREHKISKKMMFVMWFSGLRGAIAYALALHLDFEEEKRRVMVTTTLIIVLFTIIVLGGSTMPMLKYMNSKKGKGRRRRGNGGGGFRSKRAAAKGAQRQLISLSKTKEMGTAIETEHLSELTEEEFEVSFRASESNLKGFVWLDARYLMPLFTRRFTEQEVKDCKSAMTDLTNRWYDTLRRPDDVHTLSEDNEEDDDEESSDGEDLFTAYQKGESIGLNINNNNNNNNLDDDGCYPADDEEGRIGIKGSKSKSTRKSSVKKTTSSSLTQAAILPITSSTDNHLGSSSSLSSKSKLLPTRHAVYKKLSNSSSVGGGGSSSLSSSRSASTSSASNTTSSLLPRGPPSSRMPPAV